MLLTAVLWGLALSGCDSGAFLADLFRINTDAEAQSDNETRVETVVIAPGAFAFTTDLPPDITIIDGTTRYDLNADTNLLFDALPGVTSLEAGDTLIERPGSDASIVTIIRQI